MKLIKIDQYTDSKKYYVAILEEMKLSQDRTNYCYSYVIIRDDFLTKNEAKEFSKIIEKTLKK